jgi:hypothetical protein
MNSGGLRGLMEGGGGSCVEKAVALDVDGTE